ncbi:MAG: sodium-translocating pyrophosphatase [Planctomycetes bacterium]|nr:sodium-translocating pyrophosphatase [Planctomycetota bacterium]
MRRQDVLRSTVGKGIAGAMAGVACMAGTAVAQETAGAAVADQGIPLLWVVAPIGAVCALVFAFKFYKDMMACDPGDEEMQRIARHVQKGAWAYLWQQYKVVAIFFVVVSILLSIMAFGFGAQHKLVPFAFLTGGFFSALCGYFGMRTATYASNRTAQGAKESLNRGLQIAFRSGAVMGLVVVGLGLLDICMWFLLCRFVFHMGLPETTVVMLCFGMGASSQALFARVGGGIFTKAADVGADLVGKVEAGIPEDDPRNPATIADNVGDNVGDVAGMGADLYESYCGSILASAALGCAALPNDRMDAVLLPMVIAGLGIVVSIIGIYVVRSGEEATQKELMRALFKGINLSSVLVALVSLLLVGILLPGHLGLVGSIVSGLVAGVIIGKSTEYYTSDTYAPTRGIAGQAGTGPATVIIDGMAVGMFSTGVPIVTVCIGTMLAYGFAGGFSNPAIGLYGIGLASLGMLSTLGITLATDAYGPIADNAGGNAEMSKQEPYVRERTDALDALGNTTAATGKGFAIGSAALTALALLAAYIEEVRVGLERAGTTTLDFVRNVVGQAEPIKYSVNVHTAKLADFMDYYDVTLMNPKVLVGMFLGAAMAFVFCSMTMKAVGRAAGAMVREVRRQFREIAGIMEGKAEPDYASCVAISTRGAQREMVVPSLLALIMPVATGLLLGVPAVMGLLAGGLVTGFALAVMMANAGGAWDNAKKYIEKAALEETCYAPVDFVKKAKEADGAVVNDDGVLVITDVGQAHEILDSLSDSEAEGREMVKVRRGKKSNHHKAGIVGDTVGDPFKDTSGPSLNILIKLMSMVSIVFAGMVVKYVVFK